MMQPTIVLFDIDGTLISAGGAGRRAVEQALEQHGWPGGADFSFAGMTDRLIIRQALNKVAAPSSEANIDAVLEHYLQRLQQEVSDTPDARYIIHPGVHHTLEQVAARDHIAMGLGTGNVERGARIKLRRVGLSKRFTFGGFGCDAEPRAELIAAGIARGAAALGLRSGQCRSVIVGDTVRDVTAAHANGAACVAVATGSVSRAALEASGAEFVFDKLTDVGCLEAILGEPNSSRS